MNSTSTSSRLSSCIGFALRLSKKLGKSKQVSDHLQRALYYLLEDAADHQRQMLVEQKKRKVINLSDALPITLTYDTGCQTHEVFDRDPEDDTFQSHDQEHVHLTGGGSETENDQMEEAELEYLPCDRDEKPRKSDAADSKFMYVDIGDPEQVESMALEATATNEIEHHDKADSAGPVADVFQQSPEMFVQSHLANAADAREALDGLCYLKKNLREQIRTLRAPSPSRSWMVRVYLEVSEEIRRRQSSADSLLSSPRNSR